MTDGEVNAEFERVVNEAHQADIENRVLGEMMTEVIMRNMIATGEIGIRVEMRADGQREVTVPESILHDILAALAEYMQFGQMCLSVIDDEVAVALAEPPMTFEQLRSLATKTGFISLAMMMDDEDSGR